jgi:gamma-glutamylcyclotransferase (GGCT)/AIG2-like uncharacterized protein YtfP
MTALHLSPPNLFTYGSLMCEDIMAEVVGFHLCSTPAILPGYHRFLVQDEQYPGVVVTENSSVSGMLYHNITQEGWSRLDRFEGEMYDRIPVTVRLKDSTETMACCYVFRPEFHHLLTTTEWDYAAFLDRGKEIFQRHYCGFKAIDN